MGLNFSNSKTPAGVVGGQVIIPQGSVNTKPATSCPQCPTPGAFSPSQIKLFSLSCQRKWAFRHILKLPEPEQSFQTLGKDVHKHNELYLTKSILPPADTKAGQIAAQGLDRLPEPNPGHLCEAHVYMQQPSGLAFHGYPDLIPHGQDVVYDFKTTSSFTYALTPEELATDPQGLLYGYWLLKTRAFAPKHIGFRWLYYKTRTPYAIREVETSLSRNQVSDAFIEHVEAPATAMKAIRDRADPVTYNPNELPGNPGACNAYGGCPYRGQCQLHVKETFGMLFKDKLKAKPAPEPAPIVEAMVEDALQADLEAEQAIIEPPKVLAQGVVPPDAPEPVLELPEEEEPAPKGKRGRPKGSTAKPKPPVDVAEDPSPENTYSITLQVPGPQVEGFTLCINTMPMKAQITPLSDVLQPIVKALSEHLGVPYYRLAKEAEYGRADALLLSAFREVSPELKGFIYVDKRDTDSAAVLPVIEAEAVQVFRGGF